MRAKQLQRAYRVGPLHREGRAILAGQRLRQHQKAIDAVEQAEPRRRPERQARIDLAENPTQHRPADETEPEGAAEQPERSGALFRRRDVGDVGVGRAGRRGRAARQDAPEEEPAHVRGQRHDQVVHGQSEIREDDHGPAPEPVGQRAQHGRAEELHHREDRREDTQQLSAQPRVASDQAADQLRPDRARHAHGHDVQGHCHEHKDGGGLAMGPARRSLVGHGTRSPSDASRLCHHSAWRRRNN